MTLEVDADDLSDEVVEELIEQGNIPKDEADEWGDRVWFNEVREDNTQRMGVIEYLKNRFERCGELPHNVGVALENSGIRVVKDLDSFTRNSIHLLRNKKTSTAIVDDVNVYPSLGHITLDIKHDMFGTGTVYLELDTPALSNLLDYKSVENPMDLVGKSVFVCPRSFSENSQTVMIPHNVSLSGKIRFKMFGVVEEFREKTRIKGLIHNLGYFFEIFLYTVVISFFLSLFGISLLSTSSSVISSVGSLLLFPAALCFVSLSFTVFYFSYWVAMSVVYYTLRSDFIEVEA